ncbi:MAG: hypothetical protein IPM42_15180 [Saprospiraceae bacterium]|nr:hypothetical protein [Saprospiraceae bacterium]
MKIFLKKSLVVTLLLMTVHLVHAQFGYGLTASNDIYHRYSNPKDGIASPSSGSLLLNLGAGPKIWIGNPKFSFSAEAQAVIGLLGMSLGDYKGLGTVAFPIMGKLNFGGLSTFDREGKTGFSIGGGVQYSKTELYKLADKFAEQGVSRKFFATYIVQAGYGFGISGFSLQGFLRYGFNPDSKANTFNFGIQYDFNTPMLKKITNPESEL